MANVDALRNLRYDSFAINHQRAPPAVALYNNERANWCNLVANSVHTGDADATQLDSVVASASAVCTGHKSWHSSAFRCMLNILQRYVTTISLDQRRIAALICQACFCCNNARLILQRVIVAETSDGHKFHEIFFGEKILLKFSHRNFLKISLCEIFLNCRVLSLRRSSVHWPLAVVQLYWHFFELSVNYN